MAPLHFAARSATAPYRLSPSATTPPPVSVPPRGAGEGDTQVLDPWVPDGAAESAAELEARGEAEVARGRRSNPRQLHRSPLQSATQPSTPVLKVGPGDRLAVGHSGSSGSLAPSLHASITHQMEVT